MAKLSSDGKSVTVEKGDTLSEISEKYYGGASKYKQLAAINNISNPNLIYVGQVIKLTSTGSSGSSTKKANSNAPTITHFGEQSNADNTLFATWSWSKSSNTASYRVQWLYSSGDGVWFKGQVEDIQIEDGLASLARQSIYSIPSNAVSVQFKVKPISKTYKEGDKDFNYWTADWSETKKWNDSTPLATPSVPNIQIEKYKLTATLDNVNITDAKGIQFEVVKNNAASVFRSGKSNIVSTHVSYSCTVDAGAEYKVRCRAYNGTKYSEWTEYTSNEKTIPATPSSITTCKASSETSVYLEWSKVASAETYDIEYATKKEYFDGSDQTKSVNGIEFNHYDISGLDSGEEYFFRVRAVNSAGESGWSSLKSVTIGEEPDAPTTWSSTTTPITGEPLTLYWVHNSKDESSQTFAELELYINGSTEPETYTLGDSAIDNTTLTYEPLSEEDREDGKTNTVSIKTTQYIEGTTIEWRVRTAGITKVYGEWSIQRTINVYAPPTLELNVKDVNGDEISTLTSFPFYISALAGPNTQAPIGYYLTITSNEIYETTDNIGNPKTVNVGEQVYSKYFDITDNLLVELSAGHINLDNNISYTVTCVVSMDSGLTAESSVEFTVAWTDIRYEPNAEISYDSETVTTYIRPYCTDTTITTYRVDVTIALEDDSESIIVTDETIDFVYGEEVQGMFTETGEQVYSGTTGDGEQVFYCFVEDVAIVEDVTLAVYRREFDGEFTEIASGLDSTANTTVTDPHPSLDLARYRIVATSKTTGAVSYYDLPGYPINEKAVIIQWDEQWTNFETSEDAELAQPPWSGSLLRLPYNIDVLDNHSLDVTLVNYIGRKRPVSYYGTHLGETSTWDVEIVKSDKDTLYALRRLAIWTGDVYVREPSGSGYWASISVSFTQTHKELTIPVVIELTRVEGGI